ncbi:MAG: DUF1320 domain-containing protein [Phycisphaerae bacterium]|nr:DUF1320 domain-containing protein [Phycisphaerae bacterium]
MGYVTNADIEARLGSRAYVELTDDDGTGTADLEKVDEARLGAEGEVDSYLARQYAVPVDVTVDETLAGLLKSVTLDLVVFRLHCRRPPVPEDVLDCRDAAIAWLGRVAEGEVVLQTSTELPAGETRGLRGIASGHRRVLTEEQWSRI